MNDRLTALAICMKQGDHAAAAELYEELNRKVYGFLFARTRSREVAEDLSQEIFLRLVARVGSFDERKGAFVGWFWTMVRHTLVDHYRTRRETVFSAFEHEEVEMMAVTYLPDIDDRLRCGKIQGSLSAMDEDKRELFELRYARELSYRDISEILGRSEGALRVAALRIRERIRDDVTLART